MKILFGFNKTVALHIMQPNTPNNFSYYLSSEEETMNMYIKKQFTAHSKIHIIHKMI